MPLPLRSVADTKFYVAAAAPATYNAAGYLALTWTEVQGLNAPVVIGLMRESGNFDALVGGRQKYRTILDTGDVSTSIADIPTDPGQILLKAAFAATVGATAENISMRSEDATGRGVYGRGSVSSWRRTATGVQDVWMREATFLVAPDTVVEF